MLVVGLGEGDPTPESLRETGAVVVRELADRITDGPASVTFSLGTDEPELAQGLAEGALLGSYRYRPGSTVAEEPGSGDEPTVTQLTVLTSARTGGLAEAAETRARAVLAARQWINLPPNLLYPESFAEAAGRYLTGTGVSVEVLDDAQLALTGIGQFEVRTTPLQVAMISAAIANDGALMTPYLVETVRDRDLEVIEETRPRTMSRSVSASTAAALTEMMVSVVEGGSGTLAQLPGVRVAGKTGTAEYGSEGGAHAWFTGFAPADDPQIAVAVIVESATDNWTGETGGQVAAPVAKAMLEAGVGR